MSYRHDTWPARNSAVALLLVGQVVVFLISMDVTQLSLFCAHPRDGLPGFTAWAHGIYLVLFAVGIAGLFLRRIAYAYLTLLPASLLFLPFQNWALGEGLLYCRV